MMCTTSFAQQTEGAMESTQVLSYIRRAMRFSKFYPQEKVYLHLDNTGYFKGETIWFKAYVKRCDTDNRTDLSRVLYVELLNPSGDVVERRKLAIENGEANGDIKVDSIMTTGFYEIRAYTRYMTNWGANACFSRILPIFKTPQKEGEYSNPVIDKISYRHRLNNERLSATDNDNGSVISLDEEVQKVEKERSSTAKVKFFPEGGKVIAGKPCRIAFTVTDKEGIPVTNTDCKIVDAQGTTLLLSQTDNEGRGTFIIDANSTAKTIVVTDKKGKEKATALPVPEQSGCALIMDVLGDETIDVDLYSSDDILGKKLGYAMIHNGTIIRCDTMTAEPHRQFKFKRANLPSGVSQITFFNNSGAIMAERLFFNLGNAINPSKVKVKNTNESIRACGKVSFSIESEPNASISFSAIDAKGMVNGMEGNINTWMLLASDVRGYVHHPEYYFESDDTDHRKASDMLMLIQGWKRYDWKLYSGNAMFDKTQPIENMLRIYGKVKSRKKKNKIENVELTSFMSKMGGEMLEGVTMTDSLGRYRFDLPDIEGEWNLHITSKVDDEATNYAICIDRNFVPKSKYVSPQEADMIKIDETRSIKWSELYTDDKAFKSITKENHLLNNVTVKAKRRPFEYVTGWTDETSSRYFAQIYYNCDEDMDRIADEGEYPPALNDWLKTKNSFFSGETNPLDMLLLLKHDADMKVEPNADTVKAINDWFDPTDKRYAEFSTNPPAPSQLYYRDGLTYKNRPIVWIVDNMYCTITGFRMKGREMKFNVLSCDNSSNGISLPITLDEVKSIYVSEDARSLRQHIFCSELEEMDPVIVSAYTHRSFTAKQKGVRRTHFEGFNVPSVFQMEDYSVIPPMADFRRTLYWAPSVKTDANGKAKVEFYNNSSCNEMFITVEGLTEDGRAVVNEE